MAFIERLYWTKHMPISVIVVEDLIDHTARYALLSN